MNSEPEQNGEPRQGMIGLRTALVLYAALAGAAVATLKGKALALALIIVGGVAAKSVLGYLRER